MLPLVVGHCQVDDDELREHCLQAMEAFVHKCPKEVTPHIGTVRCRRRGGGGGGGGHG